MAHLFPDARDLLDGPGVLVVPFLLLDQGDLVVQASQLVPDALLDLALLCLHCAPVFLSYPRFLENHTCQQGPAVPLLLSFQGNPSLLVAQDCP